MEEETDNNGWEGLFADAAAVPQEAPAANSIRITMEGGGSIEVPVNPEHLTEWGLPGYTLEQVLEAGGISYNRSTQFLQGATLLTPDAILNPGAVVTAVGVLKAG